MLQSGLISLPLLTLGLPARLSHWLIDAGLPCVALETAAVRRGLGPVGPDRAPVLYDSRNASARADAAAAAELGYHTIDAARLLANRPASPTETVIIKSEPRRRFLEELRTAIEASGGVWVRVADFPHPYRAAVCGDDRSRGTESDVLDELLTAFGNVAPDTESTVVSGPGYRHLPARHVPASQWVRACAAAGRPVVVAGSNGEVMRAAAAVQASLVWKTTLSEFAGWWRFRSRLTPQVVRRGRRLEVTLVPPAEASPWNRGGVVALEIWRGRHCALVPIPFGSSWLHKNAVPFMADIARHPAGFAVEAASPESAGKPVYPSAVLVG